MLDPRTRERYDALRLYAIGGCPREPSPPRPRSGDESPPPGAYGRCRFLGSQPYACEPTPPFKVLTTEDSVCRVRSVTPPRHRLSRNVRRLRTAAGFTQYELAKAIGVTPSTIARIESDSEIGPTLTTAVRLASALGCTVDDLIA